MSTAASQAINGDEGGFLALMRYRNYALIWTGQLVSQTGDRMQWVAISLWVYALTGSALSVSYAIMALLIGPALVGLYAGAIVDRVDRRRIMIASDITRGVLVFAIPALMAHGIVWVYLDLFLVSAASAFFRPAMFAAIPQSVPEDRLRQANGFFAAMDTSTEIYGPILAAVFVVRFGYSSAIILNAASYFASAVFVSGLRLEPVGARRDVAQQAKVGTLRLIVDGIRYIRRDRIQLGLMALLLGGHWVAGLNSLQTPLAKGVLGISDSQFGWFQSLWGVGFVLASLLIAWYGRGIPAGQAIIFGYAFWAVATWMMGMSTNFGMLVAAGFWVGFANMLVFVNMTTVLMEHTPSDRIGRVISTRQVALAAVRVVALVGFGWLADATKDVRLAIVVMATLSFLGTLGVAIKFPVIWRYRPRAVTSEPRVAATRQEAGLVPPPPGLLGRYLMTLTTPEFAVSDQHALNRAILLILGVAWLALLAREPVGAAGLTAAIVSLFLIRALARSLARRLRLLA